MSKGSSISVFLLAKELEYNSGTIATNMKSFPDIIGGSKVSFKIFYLHFCTSLTRYQLVVTWFSHCTAFCILFLLLPLLCLLLSSFLLQLQLCCYSTVHFCHDSMWAQTSRPDSKETPWKPSYLIKILYMQMFSFSLVFKLVKMRNPGLSCGMHIESSSGSVAGDETHFIILLNFISCWCVSWAYLDISGEPLSPLSPPPSHPPACITFDCALRLRCRAKCCPIRNTYVSHEPFPDLPACHTSRWPTSLVLVVSK